MRQRVEMRIMLSDEKLATVWIVPETVKVGGRKVRYLGRTYTPSRTIKSVSSCMMLFAHPLAISAIRYTHRMKTVKNAKAVDAVKSLNFVLLTNRTVS